MRGLICAVVMALAASPMMAQGLASSPQPRPLAAALGFVQSGDWAEAARLAERDGAVAADVVEWHRLRAGQGTPPEIADFLARRSDWPGIEALRQTAETTMAEARPEEIAAFYALGLPRTPAGALSYAAALSAMGQDDAAQAAIALAWRTMPMDETTFLAYLSQHGAFLADHHAARLDAMLWEGREDHARKVMPLVGEGQARLAEARLALRSDRDGVDALIAAVPAALANDSGLAWERFMWRARKGRRDDAMALLNERSTSAKALGEPGRWAGWRASYARAEMRAGKREAAYRIASQHFLSEGSSYSDLEWLSGYIALTGLKDPGLALAHFDRFRRAVVTPISLGRAGYWIGRAHEALGENEAARAAYAEGARWQTSFYGLLAAEKAGIAFDTVLARAPLPDWQGHPMVGDSRFRAGILLLASGEAGLAERFLTRLADDLDEAGLRALGSAMVALDEPHLAVMVGKTAAERAIVIPAAYYPLHPLAQADNPVPPELALAIARRESEFDPVVVSQAGARGLMQLMPATGQIMAASLGEAWDQDRLTRDPAYNARLGKAYLAEMSRRFGGNVVMVSAAYNAGPGRPATWIDEQGDPRTPGSMDIVDWIENVPFTETRNYIMRVAESLPIYRARLGLDPLPQPFSRELVGSSVPTLAP